MKIKKSHLPMTFAFPLPSPFWFPLQIFLKIAPTTHFVLKISFRSFKNTGGTGRGQETMLIHLKIYIIIFASFCAFLLKHFYDQIKQKTGNRFHSPIDRIKNHVNSSNQINLKDFSVFRKPKFLGGLQLLVIHFKVHFKIIHLIRNEPLN